MTLRVTGMASGLDTDSIISVLVAAKRVPITDMESEIEDEQSILDAYSKIETLSQDLEDAAHKLTLSSTWNARTVTSSDDTVATATAVDGTTKGSYKLVVNKLASTEVVRSSSSLDSSSTYSGTFTINGVDITVSSADLSSVADSINDASDSMDDGYKVKAYVINNTLVIENQTSGASNKMTFKDGTAGVLQSLGIVSSSAETTTPLDYDAGNDLDATINGVKVTGSSNTITDLTGVTISVADTTDTNGITLKVGTDTEGIKDSINDYLDAYNALNTYINKATAVTLGSNSEAVSSGILQGEYYAVSLHTNLMQYMSGVASSSELTKYKSLYSIGISADSDTGDYSITDEDALDSALTSNFDEVSNLFKGSDSKGVYGIAYKSYNYLSDKVLNKLDGSLTTIMNERQTMIDNKESRISDLKEQLTAYETNLYYHFASMENMVQSWNSQLKYLLSNLGLSSS